MNAPSIKNLPFAAWRPRQVIWATVAAAAVVLAFWLVSILYKVLLLGFMAIVVATALRPAVVRVQRWTGPRASATLFVYLLLVAVLLAVLVTVAPMLFDEGVTIAQNLPQQYAEVRQQWLDSPNHVLRKIATALPTTLREPPLPASDQEGALGTLGRAFGYLGTLVWTILATVLTLLLAFYWSLEGERSTRAMLLWISPERRDNIRDLIATIEDKLGAYIRGQSLLCLIVGSMAIVAYLMIGVEQALAFGCLVGILEAVPVFGPIMGAVPPLLTALLLDPTKAVWVVVANVTIQQLENYLLVPRIMGHSVGINPIVTLLAIVAFTGLIGPLGAVMAIPLAAVFQTIVNRYVLDVTVNEPPQTDGRGRLGRLRYETQDLLRDVRKRLRNRSGQPISPGEDFEEAVEALALDLDHALATADQVEAPA